jgi:hypothetical protein
MLNEAEFTWYLRRNMWDYCAQLVTKLDNILICPDMGTTPHKLFYGENPTWIPHLHSLGEIAVVKLTDKIQSKLKTGDFQGIYLGPAEHHHGDVYSFWNPITKCSIQSRTAVLLKQTYGEFYKIDKSEIAKQMAGIMDPSKEVFDEDEDDIPEDDEGNQIVPEVADDYEGENQDQIEDENDADVNLPEQVEHHLAGIQREIRNLQTFFNPDPQSE